MDPKMTKMIGEDNFNEHCWVLLGVMTGDLWWGKIRRKSTGGPASVMFDYDWVMKHENNKENKFCICGWMHTHPHWVASPSAIDDATMRAWVTSFGRPLICVIKGTDGLRAWWYMDDESPPEEYQVIQKGDLLFGITPDNFMSNEHDVHEDEKARWEEYVEKIEYERGQHGK